jgi:catechol 2,3-dioxygenase-like lactoylglutathione lyase family enzyme
MNEAPIETPSRPRMLERIDHLVVAVADLEAARRTAVALLGRGPSWSGVHPQLGTHNVIFTLANTYVELLAPAEDEGGEAAFADALRTRLRERGDGLAFLALGTADVEAAAKTLAERGVPVGAPVAGLAQDGPSGAFRRFRSLLLPGSATGGVGVFLIEHLSEPDLLPPSLPTGDPRACVSALDHVVVMTDAPERAKAFYGDTLGIRLALDKTFEKRRVRLLFFRLGGATLEVAASIDAVGEEAAAGGADVPDDRLWGMALQVQDAALARERIAAAGFGVTPLRDGHKPGTRVFSVEGEPLGVPTLVIEPVKR